MKSRLPTDFEWPEPCQRLDKDAYAFERELRNEIHPGHPLFPIRTMPIARRLDCDDVLFETTDDNHPFAVVHLTWRGSPEAVTNIPSVAFFKNLDELLRNSG